MKLHTNQKLYQQLIRFAANDLNIPELYVEKDYWITLSLKKIFTSQLANDVVFKGGTSLSKCFNLIQRFSEDIDLVLENKSGKNPNQLKRKLKEVSELVGQIAPEVEVKGFTRKRGINRKTVHSYSKEFSGAFGQVGDTIVVETTWMGTSEPFELKDIQSYVGQLLQKKGELQMIQDYQLETFVVRVLDPRRTICEKIMSLVRFSNDASPVESLKKKIRHVYDLHMLMGTQEYAQFIESEDFYQMINKVSLDDVASFKNNNRWLGKPIREALIFSDLENIWNDLKREYKQSFSKLVFGEIPDDKLVLETMLTIRDRIQKHEPTLQLIRIIQLEEKKQSLNQDNDAPKLRL